MCCGGYCKRTIMLCVESGGAMLPRLMRLFRVRSCPVIAWNGMIGSARSTTGGMPGVLASAGVFERTA